MRANRINVIAIVLGSFLLFSCKKQTEQYKSDALSDYIPQQVGKYITYRTDSTVFTNFGKRTEIHSYQEKNIVDAQLPDGLGRPSYRILRYIRDTAGTQPWAPSGSYFITPMRNTVEVIENNLRFIKLALPIQQNYTWKGNRYLPFDPYNDIYPDWNNDDGMADWDNTYSKIGETILLNGQTITNVITVDGINETTNIPQIDPNAYASINYLQEKYAKGIGMVYQQFIMWEYQPPTSGGYTKGFGITRSMIDHN